MESFDALIRSRSRPIPAAPAVPRTAGSLPRPPRAVLFDIYGTLLAHRRPPKRGPLATPKMLRSLVRTHRLPVPPEAVSDRLTAAIEHERARLRARGVPHPEVRIERIWAKLFPGRGREELRRIAVEYELVVNPVWPAPGCRRLLGYLRGLPVALGLISNAQFYTPLLFHALLGADPAGLGFSSRLCLYSYTLGTAKPDPALFETAAARLADIGVRREETLVVGDDMASDIEPAVRLGFLTVLIGSVSPGTAAPPHAWISRLDSLRSLIEDARPLR